MLFLRRVNFIEVIMKNDFLVSVRCISYNHASYIEDCMNGFTMQETNFPYVCVIDDDASIDGESEVITNYLAEHFNMDDKDVVRSEETNDYRMIFAQHKTNKNCFFAVYFLKYNHYSIRKSRDNYVARYVDGTKYMAICEGDDYWIDALKLQKQVEYMQAHPNCTMTCNRTAWYSQKKNKEVYEQYCRKGSGYLKIEDVIKRSGLFIPTCSMVICRDVLDNFPVFCSQCLVGDYPLQILCAVKGDVFFFDDCMSIYRVDNCNSWMGTQNFGTLSEKRKEVIKSIINMLRGFATYDPTLFDVVSSTIANEINGNIPYWKASNMDINRYLNSFKNEIRNYDWRWKVDMIIRKAKIPGLRRLYTPIFLSNYQVLKKRI